MKIKKPNTERKLGRPALEEGVETIPVTVRMTSPQKEKLTLLGGSKWVRDRINRAKEPIKMKADELLKEIAEAKTTGDLRRIAGNGLQALLRKEISATDLEPITKRLKAEAKRMNTEIRLMKAEAKLLHLKDSLGAE